MQLDPCLNNKPGDEKIIVVSHGACTPVGVNSATTFTSLRAGLCRLEEHPVFRDSNHEPVVVGMAKYLQQDSDILERVSVMAKLAISEVLSIPKPGPSPIPVLIGLPQSRPGLRSDLVEKLSDFLTRQFQDHDLSVNLTFLCEGHAAGYALLASARDLLLSNTAPFCVVGGIDSYCAPETLKWLEHQGRLFGPNKWGFVPGEGAAFLTLTTESTANKQNLAKQATVVSVQTAREALSPTSNPPCTGEALVQVLDATLEPLPVNSPIDHVYCDLNGERYRAEEFGFAQLRQKKPLTQPSEFFALVHCMGDVGAATLPLLLGYIASLNGVQGKPHLLWGASDRELRGAALAYTL